MGSGRETRAHVPAEAVRFELTRAFTLAVFETATLDHYATPPRKH